MEHKHFMYVIYFQYCAIWIVLVVLLYIIHMCFSLVFLYIAGLHRLGERRGAIIGVLYIRGRISCCRSSI